MRNFDIEFPDPKNGALRPAVWRDTVSIVHRAVGSEVHRGVRLMWTACQKKDIPANAAWLQNPGDIVTCGGCKQAEAIFEEEEREEQFLNSQFGAGA